MAITIVTRAGKGTPLNATEFDANVVNLAAAIDPEHNANGTHKAAAITSGGGILHSLATAASDFLVASGAGAFVKKTLVETKALLGLVITAGKTVTVTDDVTVSAELHVEAATHVNQDVSSDSTTMTVATQADNTSSTLVATTAYAKSQDAALAREPNQGVALTAGAVAAIKTTHSAVFSNTTNSFGIGGVFSLPSWTPAANQTLRNKWVAGVGYKLEVVLTSGAFVLYLNEKTYTSAVPGGGAASNLVAGTKHSVIAVPTVGATTTTVSFSLDGVLLSTTAAQNNEDVTTTGDMYTGGTSAATFAMTVFDTYDFNRALTAAEVLDLYRKGVAESDKWGRQTELVTNGGFDSVTTGWSGLNATIASVAGGESGSCLEITRTGGTYQAAYAGKTVILGKRYRVSGWVKSGTSGNEAFSFGMEDSGFIGANPDGRITGTSSGTWTKYTLEFTVTTTTTFLAYMTAVKRSSTAGTMLFDSISLVEIGATLALESEGIQPDIWYDSSSNNLDASYPTAGATLTRPVTKKVKQSTPIAGGTGAVTVTIAMILNGVLTANPSAARAYTFEVGGTSDAIGRLNILDSFDWTIINTNATYAVTVTSPDATHTIVGNAIVALSTSGRFRTVKTATSTFITYRIN